MKIGDSISSYYLGNLFNQQNGQSKGNQDDQFDTSVRQSGAGLEPMTTPTSISSTMWAMQATDDARITPQTDAEKEASANHDALTSELSKWANMSPAEMMRAQYLEAHHLSEDSLKALPADERAAIEKEIAEYIKKTLTGNDDKGATGDVPKSASAGDSTAGGDGSAKNDSAAG